jgi:hypothetical protein
MTIAEAIRQADILRPNAIPNDFKIRWCEELDGQVAEFIGEDVPEQLNTLAEDITEQTESRELLMPHPYEQIYVLYLMAMLNNGQEETNLYANDMAVFNEAFKEARAWWRRKFAPHDDHYYKGVWH